MDTVKHNRIFVARLAPYTTSKHLVAYFKDKGALSAYIRKRSSGNIGFVTFATSEQALSVLQGGDQRSYILHKRELIIRPADSWNLRGSPRFAPARAENEIQEGIASILPVECIAIIASYLSFRDRACLERVSRRWRNGVIASYNNITILSDSSSYWGRSWDDSQLAIDGIYWMVRKTGRFLRTLQLRDEFPPQIGSIIATHCSRLEHLDLSGVAIRPITFNILGNTVRNLISLTLGKAVGPIENDLHRIFRENKQLKKVTFSASQITGKCFQGLDIQLTHLQIERCDRLLSPQLASFIKTQYFLENLKIIKGKKINGIDILNALKDRHNPESLHSLKLPGLGINNEESNEEIGSEEADSADVPPFFELPDIRLGTEGLDMTSVCKNLQILELRFSPLVDDLFVDGIGQHLLRLTSLDITGCSNIRTEFGLEPLSQLEKLETLKISMLRPNISANFLYSSLTLRTLEARDCHGISGDEICGLINSSPFLEHVDVEGCINVGTEVIACAYESLRVMGRNVPLSLYLGGTCAQYRKKHKRNFFLNIKYDRQSPRI